MEEGTEVFLINRYHLKTPAAVRPLAFLGQLLLLLISVQCLCYFTLTQSHQYVDPITHSKQLVSS